MEVSKVSHIDICLTLTEANDLWGALESLAGAHDTGSLVRLSQAQYNAATALAMLLSGHTA